jgi:membrane protease YdiL (CAAX protease family)
MDSDTTGTDHRATLAEMAVVLVLTVGTMLLGSVSVGDSEQTSTAFTDQGLVGLVGYEILLVMSLVPWLSARGWSPRVVAGPPAPRDVAVGVGLWLGTLAISATVWVIVGVLQPEALSAISDAPRLQGAVSASAVVIASVLNPVFEEFLWLGYIMPGFSPRLGRRGAAALSVALRVSVHAYQGPWALLTILPIGVLFTWYYGRTRQLWPVIVAHVILDVVGLAQYLGTRP